jgi:hypothetical protein
MKLRVANSSWERAMRIWLVLAITAIAAVAGVLSLLFVFSMVEPPDATAYVLGGLWLLLPYLAATLFAVCFRRLASTLVVLLIASIAAAFVGVTLYQSSAAQNAIARNQAKAAALPGEDPNSGPGGMRKAGAEMGAAVSSVFSILLALIMPPAQFVVIVLPALVSLLFRSRARQSARFEPT